MTKSVAINGRKIASKIAQCAKKRLNRLQGLKRGKTRKASGTRMLPTKSNNQTACTQQPIHLLKDNSDIDTSWSIESYRNPGDTNALWNLKKWFMELHKDNIAENDLVPLAQTFANVEALGCCYSPGLMGRLKELGEPIARVYRNLKNNKCSPTLVPASEVARLQRLGITYSEELENMKRWQIESLSPIIPTYSLSHIFQNIVVVNNSLKETTEWFERLGSGTISLAMRQLQYGLYEVKAFVCNIFITKSAGPYEKAHSQCVADLIEILKNYCYQVNYIRRFSILHYNVEKLVDEIGMDDRKCLRRNNIGYRMLQKLGWTGGPLGNKRTGIVNPINVLAKHDRRGLGCTKRTNKGRSPKVLESDCTMHVVFYGDLMEASLSRRPYYDLIFSPEFTETERIILTKLAVQRRIRCETRQSENGQTQFVIKRYPLPPHAVLVKVLVEKDPLVQKFYEVIPPKLGPIRK